MAGMARRAMSRPGLPKMSPMNRIRTSIGPYRNAMLLAAAVVNPRHRNAQLARTERRLGACGVERAGKPHRSRKSAKHALGNVERGIAMMFAGRRPLHAGDQQGVA